MKNHIQISMLALFTVTTSFLALGDGNQNELQKPSTTNKIESEKKYDLSRLGNLVLAGLNGAAASFFIKDAFTEIGKKNYQFALLDMGLAALPAIEMFKLGHASFKSADSENKAVSEETRKMNVLYGIAKGGAGFAQILPALIGVVGLLHLRQAINGTFSNGTSLNDKELLETRKNVLMGTLLAPLSIYNMTKYVKGSVQSFKKAFAKKNNLSQA